MEILGVILALLGLFIVITLIRAIFFKEKKQEKEKLLPEMIDMEKYCRDLSDAIKIKTISNYDRELVDWSEFDRFHAFLEERFPLVHRNMTKTKVADASLVYKWEGADPTLDGIAMLAHQDVVPITAGTEQDWTHDPFSGYNDGEFIWGRGAMDMKNHLIAVMECMEELLNEGFRPKRTVYICLGHNEEVVAAPDNGAKQIAAYLKEQGVHLEAVLDEGGAILPVKLGKLLDINLTGVGIAEKGSVNYKVSVNAKGGHSSQPPKHTAVGKLADVVRDIENHQFKAKMPDYLKQLIKRVGMNAGYPLRVVLVNAPILQPKKNRPRIRPLTGILSAWYCLRNSDGSVSTPLRILKRFRNSSVPMKRCCFARSWDFTDTVTLLTRLWILALHRSLFGQFAHWSLWNDT